MNARFEPGAATVSAQNTRVFHRHLRQDFPVAVRGEGVALFDAAGKRYIDASGGAAVSCLGHGHPDVIAAMHAQLDRLAYAHTSFFTTEVAEQLADNLIANAPDDITQVYFVSGGSEAVEAALKMARQYFVEIGQPQRRHFISRRQSYHGNTLGALAVGGNQWRRAQFEPILIDVTHVSPCYEYRDRQPTETPEAYGQRLVRELADAISQLGAENVMAFVAETGSGHALIMDGAPDGGGRDLAPRPMETVLAGTGGCTAYDVVLILKRGRHAVTGCSVKMQAERADVDPKVFTRIHMHFIVKGRGLSAKKVERAIVLSVEKYCSVAKMLVPEVVVEHECQVVRSEGSSEQA